ncbi:MULTISPECIES: prolyl oligopeptidase family protein [Chitinophaga]|uniref:prolyl oligopeptidase family serine peptidase n=1 Tax=Chitinophaga TaxID=79328 RepID=UPI001CED78E0|nr:MULTISPECIES: prolyl oligopeptidase family serine peptidase [Chitinophaga]
MLKKVHGGVLVMTLLSGVAMAQEKIIYPDTKKVDSTDNYHGQQIADPYRWLEDDRSEATKAWVTAENQVTRSYLDAIPFRGAIRQRLEELWNYPKVTAPFRQGEYYYFFKNDGLQNQAVLYRQVGEKGAPEVFLDPNKLSASGTVALGTFRFSKDGRYFAYFLAKAGSDWQEAFVMDTKTKERLSDHVDWIKFSGIAWRGNGFYYSRYDAPDEQSKLSKKNEFHKVYYHEIGTTQDKDVLIYEDKGHPLRNAGAYVTEDERFLIVTLSEGTSGREIRYRDLQDAGQAGLQVLVEGFEYEPTVVDNIGNQLLLHTNHDAPNYKLVLVDPKHPEREHWKVLIPEQPEVLQSVGKAGGKLFANYLKDASTRVVQYDYKGHQEQVISLPGIGTASGFGGKREEKALFYSFASYVMPTTIYKYDIKTGKSTEYMKPAVKFNPADYETKQVFFTSKDGTKVPMFVSYKKGMQLNGNNPVLMYGYGGFNIPMTPGFSVSNFFFMEQGGIYVVVSLRGGSEYGEQWHKAGMLDRKQNVFDDFIGAAEHLVKERYTNPGKIAISGGSNGGLLIGACMTQRPDLFKVALPSVGVLDMLRYQKFTIGWAWAVEYGSSDHADQFKYLIRYSPLHNLKAGTQYPATMITTADHDDRVVPAHSFKFAAALQAIQTGPNPALIRIGTQAGHGAGKPTAKLIDEATDMWAFVMYNLGVSMK